METVADCVLRGSQWIERGHATVPGTLDRSVSRPDTLHVGLTQDAQYLRETVPDKAAELDALIAREAGHGAPLVGFRSYPRSDFSAYQRPAFSFFVKTVSDRTFTTEVGGNGEDLKGHLLSCGDDYILRDGEEYFNLPPVWNWDLLPGITWAQGAGSIQRESFVGSVSDETAGAIAMDSRFGTKTATDLSDRKFWACDGDTVVCLIGGLTATGLMAPVRTAMDQCRLQGPVTIADASGAVKTLALGDYPAQPIQWVQHSGLVYLPIGVNSVSFHIGPSSGSWYSINHGRSKDLVTEPVFLPVLEQGASPNGQSSGYVIAAAAAPKDAAKIAAKPSWEVLRNDSDCQAVRFNGTDLMAAFYQSGALQVHGKMLIAVDQPCLLLLHNDQLRVCDPTQKGGSVTITKWDGSSLHAVMPPGGLTSDPVQ